MNKNESRQMEYEEILESALKLPGVQEATKVLLKCQRTEEKISPFKPKSQPKVITTTNTNSGI